MESIFLNSAIWALLNRLTLPFGVAIFLVCEVAALAPGSSCGTGGRTDIRARILAASSRVSNIIFWVSGLNSRDWRLGANLNSGEVKPWLAETTSVVGVGDAGAALK